jgi:alpha-mannosidase
MRARWNRHGIGHIPAAGQLLSVDSPDFAVSAIKRAEDGDGVVVRVYNITNDEASATIDLKPVTGAVTLTNLNEEEIAEVPRLRAAVPVTARPNEIITLRFRREQAVNGTA